jgi:hypothetical protein
MFANFDLEDEEEGRMRARRSRRRECVANDEEIESPSRKRRARETHERVGRYDAEHESTHSLCKWRLNPEKSIWWEWLHHHDVADPKSATGRRFRRRFRVPYALYQRLLRDAQEKPQFADKVGGRGPPTQPLSMKLLAALRYLATGDTFDSLEDTAHISESTLRKFTFDFIDWVAVELYKVHVALPAGDDLDLNLEVYRRLGFPGA